MKARICSAALSLLLGACSFAPRYKVPETAQAPQAYLEEAGWSQAKPLAADSQRDWWVIFNDPQLNELEAKVIPANQDLKAAFARLQQARAEVRATRSNLFPTITVGPEVTRARESGNAPRNATGIPATGNDFILTADLSYEVDVWGRVRNALKSARATAAASADDLAALDLSVHAELANDYFALASDDARQILFDETVGDYQRALDLTQRLHGGGAAAVSDVAQAQVQLETAKTQAEDNRLDRAQLQHAIAVLVGESPSTYVLAPKPLPLDLPPPSISAGMPSTLLQRRPDVAAAERRVVAANAEIGVARAAYFPVFDLSASAGYESRSASTWIDAPSGLWSLGSSALLTVFDAGRHRALSDEARAAYDEQVANYRLSVLNAYREVEDNIAAIHHLERETVTEGAAVQASQTAATQANNRYRGGVATYLEVVTTQNAALLAQLSARSIQARHFSATILLVKALGGGWHNDARLAANVPEQQGR